MVVEVMGRYAGWIALYAGVAGGADAILIPEIPFDIAIVAAAAARARSTGARKFSIVVVAEGAYPEGRHAVAARGGARRPRRAARRHRRAGRATRSARETGKETRSVVLGHLQRGGAPTSFDRVLATRFGGKAVELVRRGEFGTMVAFAPPDIVARPLDEVVGKTKTVPHGLRPAADGEGARRHVRRLKRAGDGVEGRPTVFDRPSAFATTIIR